MAALRYMIEKVGRTTTGFYNIHGGVRRTKLGVFGAVNNNNNNNNNNNVIYNYHHHQQQQQHLHCSVCIKAAQQVRASEGFDLPLEGLNRHPGVYNGLEPYFGSFDNPAITKPAIIAVEQYNKQQNANLEFVRVVKINCRYPGGIVYFITLEAIDNGVKNTYEAKIFHNFTKRGRWELKLFRLAPPVKPTNLIDN